MPLCNEVNDVTLHFTVNNKVFVISGGNHANNAFHNKTIAKLMIIWKFCEIFIIYFINH